MKTWHGMVMSALLLAACSSSADKGIDYQATANQVPELDVPPGLSLPISNDTYKVPPIETRSTVRKNADDIAMQIEESGINSILIRDKFDQSWRRIGLAIERLKLTLEDKDRSKGWYDLQPIKVGGSVMLPKENLDAQTRYRVLIQEDNQHCRVTVVAADGISDAGSKKVLEALYQNIEP